MLKAVLEPFVTIEPTRPFGFENPKCVFADVLVVPVKISCGWILIEFVLPSSAKLVEPTKTVPLVSMVTAVEPPPCLKLKAPPDVPKILGLPLSLPHEMP